MADQSQDRTTNSLHQMRAFVYDRVGAPEDVLHITSVPRPSATVVAPGEALIRVRAAAVNQLDLKMASGLLDWADKSPFPRVLGRDFAGVVDALGPAHGTKGEGVETGTVVMGFTPQSHRGTFAEHAAVPVSCLVPAPRNISLTDAASLPLVGSTVAQAFQRADSALPGGLRGKTVLVPGGLGGVGAIAVQVAKRVYGCCVITTVSTSKLGTVEQVLGQAVVDVVADYQKDDLVAKIGLGQVDFLLDTAGVVWDYLPLVRKHGVVVCISTTPNLPPGREMRKMGLSVGWHVCLLLTCLDYLNRLRAWARGVKYSYLCVSPVRDDLQLVASWVQQGQVRPVVGRTVDFSQEAALKSNCQQLFDGRGPIGKFVVNISQEE